MSNSNENVMPTVVILISDSNDENNSNGWQTYYPTLIPIFEKLGVRAISAPWSKCPDSNNPSSSIYVANLAWGYDCVPDRWNAWLDAWPDHIRLINSKSLLKWNTYKTYLQDLETQGVPIVPTLYVDKVNETTLANAATHFNRTELVVKPVISASSRNTFRISIERDDLALISNKIDTNERMMIQPFMSSISHEGEISVLVFNGKVSHAVRKIPHQDDFRVQNEYGGVSSPVEPIPPEILSLVQITMVACPEQPIYARIDMVRNDKTNVLSIMELELIEPGLFLHYAPDKGHAFAQAILQHR